MWRIREMFSWGRENMLGLLRLGLYVGVDLDVIGVGVNRSEFVKM